MNHQQKEQLQKRIKRLEEEIIQRTRNYMYQHSLSKSRRKDSVTSRGSQTDSNFCKKKESTSPTPKKQSFTEFFNQIISPQKLSFEGTKDESPCKSLEEKIEVGVDWLRKFEYKEEIFEDMTRKIISLSEQNEIYRQNNLKLEKMLKQTQQIMMQSRIQQKKQEKQRDIESEKGQETIDIEQLKLMLQQSNHRFRQMQKAIMETEQRDYKLRLTIQSLEHQIKAKQELLEQMKQGSSKREADLKGKIEQMQVIKKQYLRAYSKIKQEKEAIQLHIMENKEGKELKLKMPLTSISEEQQEHIDEIIRSSTADNSLGVIKNFMERSLIQSNRPSMQKWITVSISKLDQLQNDSEHKISDIHESYRNLLRQMADNFKNQMKVLQKQFQKTLNKVFTQDVRHHQFQQKQTLSLNQKSLKRSSSYEFINSAHSESNPKWLQKNIKLTNTLDCNDDVIDSEEFLEKENNWETICKLSISQAKCVGLQQKYGILVHKLAQQNLKQSRIHHQFNQMMEKLVNFHKAGHEAFELRINFIEICEKVFKILQNLPTGNHGEIYFVPKDFEELNEALNVLFRFSHQYDKINQEKMFESNRKLDIIRTLMEQIFHRNNVCFDEVDQVLRKSLTDESQTVSEFMGQLIENMRRNRESNSLAIGNVISFGQSSKMSGIN